MCCFSLCSELTKREDNVPLSGYTKRPSPPDRASKQPHVPPHHALQSGICARPAGILRIGPSKSQFLESSENVREQSEPALTFLDRRPTDDAIPDKKATPTHKQASRGIKNPRKRRSLPRDCQPIATTRQRRRQAACKHGVAIEHGRHLEQLKEGEQWPLLASKTNKRACARSLGTVHRDFSGHTIRCSRRSLHNAKASLYALNGGAVMRAPRVIRALLLGDPILATA